MASFLELQDDLYFWLGTTDQNKAFPRTQIKRLINMAKNAFWRDCLESYPDVLSVTRTLVADGTDNTSYVFSAQSPTLGDVAKITEVRLTDSEGLLLDEAPYSERYRKLGVYSLLGVGSSIVLYAGRSVSPGGALYIAYVPAAADLVANGDSPTWFSPEFHDVLSLKAAKLAAGSGNEQTLSPLLLETLQDREAQARFAFGQRSLTPTTARER